KIKVLLLSGPSSAGKTTSSNILCSSLEKKGINSIVISLDNFYIDRLKTPKLKNGDYDYENITTLDLDYFNNFIDSLLKFHSAKMPIFNFLTGKREKKFTDITIDEKSMIIIEGLHALNPNLIKKHKHEIYKVYVNMNANYTFDNSILIPAKDIRLIRRITRDFFTRGYSALETISTWQNVNDGEDKWIKPFKLTANYIIDSSHEYEILLYSKYTTPILKKLIFQKDKLLRNKSLNKTTIENSIEKAKYLYISLKKATSILKNKVPKNSLLQEFVGKAKNIIEPSGKIFN
ncbi:MAG: nucleoside kinase, partial [Clostridia bacterium]|nr:nucleoside kinase [Clostridia bacterium]